MKINEIINNEIVKFINESRQDYLNWKRKNVTIRGVKEDTQTENGGGGMLGLGLYTAFLSNYALAKQYGKVYFVLNAIPKHPIVFNTLNDWEIWQYNTMITNYCKRMGVPPSSRYFHSNTSITEEIKHLGYDGVVIKGREMVNYNPENPIFFEHEYQLENYYNAVVGSKSLNEILNEENLNNGLYGYHATTCNNVNLIKKYGFRIGDRNMQGRGVYGFYNVKDNSSGGAAFGYGMRHVSYDGFCIVQFKIISPEKILILDKDIAYDVKGERGNIITQIEDLFGGFDNYWGMVEKMLRHEFRTEEYKKEFTQKLQNDFDNQNSKNLMFGTANLEHLSQYGIIFDGEYGMEYLIKEPTIMQPTGYYEVKREEYKIVMGDFIEF